jgi:hypothetical protein
VKPAAGAAELVAAATVPTDDNAKPPSAALPNSFVLSCVMTRMGWIRTWS